MTTYQVSLGQMGFVGGEMESISQQISQTLQSLDDAARQNLADWADDARDAYTAAKAKWDAAAAAMQQQSVQATQSLGDISSYYTSGEKFGVNLWQA